MRTPRFSTDLCASRDLYKKGKKLFDMKILVHGISGHMGREVAELCERGYRGAELSLGVDRAEGSFGDSPIYAGFSCIPESCEIDCIVDFSHHTAVASLLDFARERGIPTVVATTGHTDEELAQIRAAAEDIAVFHSANMSLGVALLVELAKTAAAAMPEAEIEIIEKHHNRKLDAPSGTALLIADEIKSVREQTRYVYGRSGHAKRTPDEIGIHAIRMGNVVGDHEVIVATDSQTITLKHEAHSRALFAEGSVAAAKFLCGKPAGRYDMKSMLAE